MRRPPAAPLALALVAVLAAGAAAWPAPSRAEPPPEDHCPLLGGRPGTVPEGDAIPVPLREGMSLRFDDLMRLQQLLPPEIWRLRSVFFHEGMRMEIGPCHRRYPVPAFFTRATAEFAGRARVDRRGNLSGYTAGLPFPPAAIDAKAKDAGVRWAWNFATRYRGAGPSGSFRIVDMPGRDKGEFVYEGSYFQLLTSHRADLAKTGYGVPEAAGAFWIAGGRFDEPFNARHLAWRQVRPLESLRRYEEPDDTFVYVPNMRKVRRASTAWIDGFYMPRYRVGGDDGGGGIAIGGDVYSGSQGAINPTASRSTMVTENLRAGFTGLSLRPNAYAWRVMAEREVIAPLNGTREGYPDLPERNFGPSGLSVGSDRWDVRWAVVLRGERLEPGEAFQRIDLWIDWQTQQPLYVITRQKKGRLVDVAVLVHRFSGDLSVYPDWPGGQKAWVFDPVLAVSYSPLEDGTGWRRESYDTVSVPPDAGDLRRYTTTDFLVRGH